MNKPKLNTRSDAVIMCIDGIRTRATTNEAVLSPAVPLEHADLISNLMGKIGRQVRVAMALVEDQTKGHFGQYARVLKLSGFCNHPKLYEIFGGDKQYLEWLKTQKCHFHRKDQGACEGDIVPAHVRRIQAGAGTGIKPALSAISLCDKHNQLQHAHGECSLMDREQFDTAVLNQLEAWVWYEIKQYFGVNSMADLDPERLLDFALENGLGQELPAVFRKGQGRLKVA